MTALRRRTADGDQRAFAAQRRRQAKALRAALPRVRGAFADAFMAHPTGRMTDIEVMAVLDALTKEAQA